MEVTLSAAREMAPTMARVWQGQAADYYKRANAPRIDGNLSSLVGLARDATFQDVTYYGKLAARYALFARQDMGLEG